MNTPLETFFDHIIVVNLKRRPDRMASFAKEMELIGVTNYERFEAIDAGPGDGNTGCSASHKAVMDLIVKRGYKSCLVFEDDSVVRHRFRDSFNIDVVPPLRELPEGWLMLYLGGGYGSMPRGWHSRHLILTGQIKTTSSYAVSAEAAQDLRDLIPDGTADSIDNLYSGYTETQQVFITEPRFFFQYENYSNLQERVMGNQDSMENSDHTNALGKYLPK